LELIQAGDLQYYRSGMTAKHGIFTRAGGVSPYPFSGLNLGGTVGDDVANVHRNHALMYDVMAVDGKHAVTTWQVHGADVVVAYAPVPERKWLAKADGMITNQANVPLVMRFADCVPLLYHDPVKNAIGLAHAGWRGTVQGMAREMVYAMQDAYGSKSKDIVVVIGPSISQAHFQVGEEVIAAIHARYGVDDALVCRDPKDGTAYVNLWEANRRDLQAAGVENIEVMGLCTYERTDQFYSHRAEKGRTGRFGVVLSL
jgi:polyphenol oxidase